MDERMSRSAIDRLGKRLAHAVVPAADDLKMLWELQAAYAASLDMLLEAVPDVLSGPILARASSVHLSHREKTAETLVDKLRRGTSLSRMQDVVGARLVGDFGLGGQDEIVARIGARFPEVRVDDRRARPSHGYRAVHVIPTISGHQLELQVRTSLQHAWANTTERLADEWGRGIRYGARPTGATEDEIRLRSEQLASWIEASDCVARIENAMAPSPDGERVTALAEDARRAVTAAVADLRSVLQRGGLEIGEAMKTALAATGYSESS